MYFSFMDSLNFKQKQIVLQSTAPSNGSTLLNVSKNLYILVGTLGNKILGLKKIEYHFNKFMMQQHCVHTIAH